MNELIPVKQQDKLPEKLNQDDLLLEKLLEHKGNWYKAGIDAGYSESYALFSSTSAVAHAVPAGSPVGSPGRVAIRCPAVPPHVSQ